VALLLLDGDVDLWECLCIEVSLVPWGKGKREAYLSDGRQADLLRLWPRTDTVLHGSAVIPRQVPAKCRVREWGCHREDRHVAAGVMRLLRRS
jgi:hypothetical protein